MKGLAHAESLQALCDLSTGQAKALYHLLSCEKCRRQSLARLGESLSDALGEMPELMPPSHPLDEALAACLEKALRQSAEAEQLWLDLLAYPAGEQGKALRERRFHSQALVSLMLKHSRQAQPGDPESAFRWADLASQLAVRLHRAHACVDEEAIALWHAEAANLSANAQRLMGRGSEAQAWFEGADRFLRFSGSQTFGNAEWCRYLGLLRWEQDQLEEAEALLRQGARIFSDVGMAEEEGASWVLLGLLNEERNRPGKAMLLLQSGLAILDPEARPWLTLRARLGLALVLAERGLSDQASALLTRSSLDGERDPAREMWLEGKVYARLGRREDAVRRLETALGQLTAESSPDAALCSWDLAALLLEESRRTEACSLLSEIAASFAAEPIAKEFTRWAAGATAPAAMASATPADHRAQAGASLRRLLRSRGYRVEPLPFV